MKTPQIDPTKITDESEDLRNDRIEISPKENAFWSLGALIIMFILGYGFIYLMIKLGIL